tara:strand:+ start:1877 stop:3169 length:1293 start_codon:yes stop_codon:yes gene_type:complete
MSTVTKIKDNFIYLIKNFPDDWELSKNKYAFLKIRNGKNMSDTTDVLSLTINGIKIKEDLTFGKTSNSYIGHQLVNVGDLVFTPRDFDQTPILSDVSKYDGCISNLYIVDKPNKEFLPEYINYFWYGLKHSFDYFKNFSYGIRFSFNREQFDEIPILKPSLNEQKIICTYLDDKLKHIDALVNKIDKKINLLKEQKTSLINQCVTKGLDPNVETKDSGVEWIGEIPKHWEITRLKYHGEVLIGLSFDKDDIVDEGQGTLVLRSSNVQNGQVNFSDNVWVNTDVPDKLFVQKGDILICSRNGSRDLIGKNCLLGQESIGMTWGVFMTVFRSRYSEFFYWILNSQVFKSQSGLFLTSTINQLTVSTLKNLVFPFVSNRTEQNRINEFLKKETKSIDELIDSEQRRTSLLKEYRQSLISSVVTGKVRVTEDMI